jgi:hypothetical protein
LVNYPNLTPSQQKDLPALIQPASMMAAKFEDSTHQLWQCQTIDGPMMLKVCNQQIVAASSFWQGMNSLFALSFPACLADMAAIYKQVQYISPLIVPEYIASDFYESASYILVRLIEGDDINAEAISDEMVQNLAHHISDCHRHQSATWGTLLTPQLSEDQWSTRLQCTLRQLATTRAIPQNILQDALQQAGMIKEIECVSIMIDLRWDQFLHQNGKLTAIVDLDAFVTGPRALELVLLEYLLDKRQAVIFKQYYEKTHLMPDLTKVRTAYRVLLFLMNVLGDTDIKHWMNSPHYLGN